MVCWCCWKQNEHRSIQWIYHSIYSLEFPSILWYRTAKIFHKQYVYYLCLCFDKLVHHIQRSESINFINSERPIGHLLVELVLVVFKQTGYCLQNLWYLSDKFKSEYCMWKRIWSQQDLWLFLWSEDNWTIKWLSLHSIWSIFKSRTGHICKRPIWERSQERWWFVGWFSCHEQ